MPEALPIDRYLVPGLQRGLQLLAHFTRATPLLTGAELSRRMGLPRASVFRLLQTLEHMGFVQRQGNSNHYKLSIAVLRLGFEYLASMELAEQARPVLEALSATTGLSSHLVVRDAREVVFVAKALGQANLFNPIQLGARLPAHATALGRILLADLSLPELHSLYADTALPVFTAKTPTSLEQLWNLVEDDRRRGFGISQGGFEAGISTIAAPVLDDRRLVCAAVSVTVHASQIDPALRDRLVIQVRAAAQQLSQGVAVNLSSTPRAATALNKVSR